MGQRYVSMGTGTVSKEPMGTGTVSKEPMGTGTVSKEPAICVFIGKRFV